MKQTSKFISLAFLTAVLMSLKRSRDQLRYQYRALSDETELASPYYLRRRIRRNFTLQPHEFHVMDLDFIEEQRKNRTARVNSRKTGNETTSQSASHQEAPREPIHATLLIERYGKKQRNSIQASRIADRITDSIKQNLSLNNENEQDEPLSSGLTKEMSEEVSLIGLFSNNDSDSSGNQLSDSRIDELTAETQVPAPGSVIAWNIDTFKAVERGEIFDTKVNVSGILGRIEGQRLVVDADESYVFWNHGQSRLCDLLRAMTLRSSLDEAVSESRRPRPLLNVTMNCLEMKKNENFGQGNWITALYDVRLAAARAQVDYQMQCSDRRQSQMQLLLPWFDGYHAAPNSSDPWPYFGERPSEQEACTESYYSIRIDKMAGQIIDDIQRMAVTLVGSRDAVRRHESIPEGQEPLISDVQLDDVAIHFRCGDVMGGARRHDFGMIKFSEYSKWISPDAQTIGILTQPFDKTSNRMKDVAKVDACREATFKLVGSLQSFLPNARISIHNGINETLPLAYARLAMANQSFTSLSSFGIFPVVGTFGHGYFQQGNRGVNPFASHLPQYLPNLHEMQAPKLSTGAMYNMKLEEILEWLTSPEATD